MTRNVGDIDHGDIHTDITHILGFLTIHQTITMTIAKVTVQSVSITDRNSSDHTVALYLSLTTVAHRLASWYMTHLKNGGLQCGYSMQDTVIARVNTIKAKT